MIHTEVIPANPDHGARLVLMSAYLYYWCDSPVISDGNYDSLARYVSKRWNDLAPLPRYMLGSWSDIKASGSGVRVSRLAEDGARAWHHQANGDYPVKDLLPSSHWRPSLRFRLDLAHL